MIKKYFIFVFVRGCKNARSGNTSATEGVYKTRSRNFLASVKTYFNKFTKDLLATNEGIREEFFYSVSYVLKE